MVAVGCAIVRQEGGRGVRGVTAKNLEARKRDSESKKERFSDFSKQDPLKI